jgi:hypothetical protein
MFVGTPRGFAGVFPGKEGGIQQGILKGEVSLYSRQVWISLYCKYKQKLSVVIQLIQNQTGGRRYSDTSPYSIPRIQVFTSLAPYSQTVGFLLRTPWLAKQA